MSECIYILVCSRKLKRERRESMWTRRRIRENSPVARSHYILRWYREAAVFQPSSTSHSCDDKTTPGCLRNERYRSVDRRVGRINLLIPLQQQQPIFWRRGEVKRAMHWFVEHACDEWRLERWFLLFVLKDPDLHGGRALSVERFRERSFWLRGESRIGILLFWRDMREILGIYYWFGGFTFAIRYF